MADYHQSILDRSDEDVEEMVATARDEADRLGERIDELDGELDRLRSERQELLEANAQLSARARNYRTDADAASGEEAFELLETALEAEAERHRNNVRVEQLEYSIERAEADRRHLEIRRASAEARRQAAQEVLDSRRELVQEANGGLAETLQQIRSKIDQQQSLRHEHLERVAELLDRAASLESDASDALELAATSFERAARLAGRPGSASYLAQQADALVAVAKLDSRQIRMQERLDAALSWQAGQDQTVDRILGYLDDIDDLRDVAVSIYEEAVQLYSRAAGDAEPDRRWVYEAEAATAAIGLYRMTGSAEHRRLAEDALDVIEEIIDSPHLRPVVDLVHMMHR